MKEKGRRNEEEVADLRTSDEGACSADLLGYMFNCPCT